MKIFSKILSKFKKNKKDFYIYYKIINHIEENQYLILQCINKKTIFHAKIEEVVFDTDILYGLHPIQACYVGIEYSNITNKINFISSIKPSQAKQFKNYFIHRYGKYRLLYQNRKGDICFVDEARNEVFLLDPKHVALSEELIQEFDSTQAFYIGYLTGCKINPISDVSIENKKYKKPILRLVK